MEVTVPDSVSEIGRCSFGYYFNKKTWNDEPVIGFVLKGYKGSAADTYANGCGVKFESIGDSVLTPPTEPIPTEPPEPGTVITLYYKNTSNFATPYAYYWPKNGSGSNPWPGVAMTKVSDDVYKIDVPVENNMIIFSDNGNNKTDDLAVGENNQIYDGDWKDYEEIPTQSNPTESEPTTSSEKVNVIFDGNGGEGTMNTVTLDANTDYILPQCEFTAPEGKEFVEWEVTYDSKIARYMPGSTITVSSTGAQCKAIWEDKTPALLGDVNGDGILDISDATIIMKHSIRIPVDINLAVADFNDDGDVNVKDVTAIQRAIAQLM